VAELDAVAEEASRAVEEFIEENANDEGLLSEAMDDGKVTKSLAAARLKEAKREGSDPDEVKALEDLIDLYAKEANAKKKAKDARGALDLAVLRQYGELTEADVMALVLEQKWLTSIQARVTSEGDAFTLALVDRIQELGARYAKTVSDISVELDHLADKVAAHLADMGVTS
jgi:type I restriction enzyme M protein